jgi:hypothetical protein
LSVLISPLLPPLEADRPHWIEATTVEARQRQGAIAFVGSLAVIVVLFVCLLGLASVP